MTCFVSKPSRNTLVELSIINTSYQKLLFGSKGYIKNKSRLNDEKYNTGIRFSEPTINFAVRHTMTHSSRKQQHCCCSNSSNIATQSSSSSSSSGSSTLYANKTDFSIAQTTPVIIVNICIPRTGNKLMAPTTKE